MARALGYEIEPSGERAFADAMLREVITYWLSAGIDGPGQPGLAPAF